MALTDNLVSYWKLDETGSSNAADSVGSNTLTNTNTVTYSTGKINNGANFTSASSMKLSSASNLGISGNGNITLSSWFKVATNPANGITYCINSHTSTSVTANYINTIYWQSGGVTQLGIGASAVIKSLYTITLTTGTWYHIVATRDTSLNLKLYLNGSLVSSDTSTAYNLASDGFSIGSQTNNASYLNGSVDETAVYNRVLSSDEVSQLYNSNRALAYPLTAPTLYGGRAYYKLDESSGDAADSIGNLGTLTNNNTTTYAAAKINNGAVFNGSNQLFNSASVALTTNAWTINVWVNPDDADIANQTFFSYRPASGAVNIIQCEGLATRAVRCLVYSSNGTSYKDYRTSLTLTQGAWNLFSLTWDGTTLTPYINGTADTSITKTVDNAVTQTLTARVLRLGAETAAGNFFDGNEDEFLIADRAFTAAEISTLYNGGAGLQYPWAAAAGPANLKSLNGILKANIKSINGILIGNVKSIDGIS